jgi:hypothetical protein
MDTIIKFENNNYIDPEIEALDNAYTEDMRKQDLEQEIAEVKGFWSAGEEE